MDGKWKNEKKKRHTCIIRISELSVLLRNYDKGCERWAQVDLQCNPHYVGYSGV